MEIRQSSIPGAMQGLYARQDIQAGIYRYSSIPGAMQGIYTKIYMQVYTDIVLYLELCREYILGYTCRYIQI